MRKELNGIIEVYVVHSWPDMITSIHPVQQSSSGVWWELCPANDIKWSEVMPMGVCHDRPQVTSSTFCEDDEHVLLEWQEKDEWSMIRWWWGTFFSNHERQLEMGLDSSVWHEFNIPLKCPNHVELNTSSSYIIMRSPHLFSLRLATRIQTKSSLISGRDATEKMWKCWG